MAPDLSAGAPEISGVADEPTASRRRRRRTWIAGAALVAVVAVATAVALAAGIGTSGSSPSRNRVAVEGAAPVFDLPRVAIDGERVRLADWAGRPVVVNFWASWCAPCRKEMPALQAASEQLEGQVAFVGVNHQDGRSAAAEFERDAGVRYPSGYDPEGAVARDFGVVGLPTTVLVDTRGRIVARHLGEITEDQLLALVAKAFGAGARRSAP